MGQGAPAPQINVSKIPGSGGIAGALFAIGGALILLVGIPRLRLFFVGAALLGCGVALILRYIRRETPGKPWILPDTRTAPTVQHPPEDDGNRTATPRQRSGFAHVQLPRVVLHMAHRVQNQLSERQLESAVLANSLRPCLR